jgi:hypothetical protein
MDEKAALAMAREPHRRESQCLTDCPHSRTAAVVCTSSIGGAFPSAEGARAATAERKKEKLLRGESPETVDACFGTTKVVPFRRRPGFEIMHRLKALPRNTAETLTPSSV